MDLSGVFMKIICLAVLALLSASPSARAATYYTCGCTGLNPANPAYKNRTNWEFRNAWSVARAKERVNEACDARFGRGIAFYGNCLPVKLEGKQLAKYQRDVRRMEREDQAPRREPSRRASERQDSYNRANRGLDEVIRRNREDEIDRVLKEARECRMYGNCPGR